MILKTQKADANGVIRAEKCAQTLYLGIRSQEPYLLYLEAEEGEKYNVVTIQTRVVGDPVSIEEMMGFNVTVASGPDGSCLFFTPKPKIVAMGGNQGPALPPGMSLPGRTTPQ